MLDELAKHDKTVRNSTAATIAPDRAVTLLRKAANVPTPKSGLGEITSEVGGHATEEVEIADPFSAAVRRQVEAAGGKYEPPPRPIETQFNEELHAAAANVIANAPLLNELTKRRKARKGGVVPSERVAQQIPTTPYEDSSAWGGTESGDLGGTSSGSASGSASGEVSKLTKKGLATAVQAGIRDAVRGAVGGAR
jgi:hypothetical protein